MPAPKKMPTKEQLVKLLKQMSQRQIAKQFGVCEKTIRKWKVKHGIANQKSAYYRRPQRAVLIRLLGQMNQKQIAEKFGVCEQQVLAWKRHHNIEDVPSLHMIPAEEQPNPIVECQCGCGETFPKWKFGRRPADGKLWRYERRFVNGHGNRWHQEQNRIRQAEHWAKKIGDKGAQLGASLDPNLGDIDFSDEYLGEAWIALAEGKRPQDAVKEQKREEDRNRHRHCDIEKILKHPDICEQVCVSDPEPEV